MEYVYRTTQQSVEAEETKPPSNDLPWELMSVSSERQRPPQGFSGRDYDYLTVVWRVLKAEVDLQEARRQAEIDRIILDATAVVISALIGKSKGFTPSTIKFKFDSEIRVAKSSTDVLALSRGIMKALREEARILSDRGLPLDTDIDKDEFLRYLLNATVWDRK